jgi:hypothetical protein
MFFMIEFIARLIYGKEAVDRMNQQSIKPRRARKRRVRRK